MMQSVSLLVVDPAQPVGARRRASSSVRSTSSSFLPPSNVVPVGTMTLDSDPLALTMGSQFGPQQESGSGLLLSDRKKVGSAQTGSTTSGHQGLTASASVPTPPRRPSAPRASFSTASIRSEAHYEEVVRMLRSMCSGDADAALSGQPSQ